jgi:hypothetical protein
MVLTFYQNNKSPSTLNRKVRISMQELYHTSQQLSQYDFYYHNISPTSIRICKEQTL